MSRRFVICVGDLTAEHQANFRSYLDKRGGQWWHWIENVWLADFPDSSDVTVEEIWSLLNRTTLSQKILVLEIKDLDWKVSGSLTFKGQKMSQWLTDNWMD